MNKTLEVFIKTIQNEFANGKTIMLTNMSESKLMRFHGHDKNDVENFYKIYVNIPNALLQFVETYFSEDEEHIVPIFMQSVNGDAELYLMHPGEAAKNNKTMADLLSDLTKDLSELFDDMGDPT